MEHSGGSALVEGSKWAPVIMSWIVILFLAIVSFIGTRKMEKVPGKFQSVLELLVSALFDFIEGVIGPGGRKYAPFIASIFIYILVMNVFGVIPFFKSPTSGLNMTIALALSAFFYVQVQAIRANGFVGYIKHFVGDPWWLAPLMLPIHIIGEIAKPLSLSIRLFGNIFGEDKIIVILAMMSPYLIKPWIKYLPIHFPMLIFAIFTGVIQALIFMVLTSGYLTILVSHGDEVHTTSSPH